MTANFIAFKSRETSSSIRVLLELIQCHVCLPMKIGRQSGNQHCNRVLKFVNLLLFDKSIFTENNRNIFVMILDTMGSKIHKRNKSKVHCTMHAIIGSQQG